MVQSKLKSFVTFPISGQFVTSIQNRTGKATLVERVTFCAKLTLVLAHHVDYSALDDIFTKVSCKLQLNCEFLYAVVENTCEDSVHFGQCLAS